MISPQAPPVELLAGAAHHPEVLVGELRLPGAEVDLPAADPRQPLRLGEQAAAALELPTGTTGAVELEVGAHPRAQLAGRERLDQVVVRAGVEALAGCPPRRPGRRASRPAPRPWPGRPGGRRAARSRPSAASSRRSAPGPAAAAGPARARRRRPRRSARRSRRRAARRRTPGCRRCRRRRGSAAGRWPVSPGGLDRSAASGSVQCVASARKPSATAADGRGRGLPRAGELLGGQVRAAERQPDGERRALGPPRSRRSPGRRAGRRARRPARGRCRTPRGCATGRPRRGGTARRGARPRARGCRCRCR